MNLRDQLQSALGNVSQFSLGEHLLELDDGPQHLIVRLSALDSLACAVTTLALRCESLAGKSLDQLKGVAERLSSRLTYLLEPISPIEIDAEGCTVQMRSNPPLKETDRTSYYELLVSRRGELSLCRYARATGEARQPIPAHLTREVLARLVADFSAVAA